MPSCACATQPGPKTRSRRLFSRRSKAARRFAGRSAEKSWLVGILKNKISDHYRKASRETSFHDLEFYSDEESDRFVSDGPFKDGWIHELGPREWSSPGASLDSEVFWKTFSDCSNKLPKNVAAVFTFARGGRGGGQGDLRPAEHLGKQPVGHAASGANGVAPLPGNKLVCEAGWGPMNTLEPLSRHPALRGLGAGIQ